MVTIHAPAAFVWWVAGIPWDFVHCAGNIVVMLVFYRPIRKAMEWACNSF